MFVWFFCSITIVDDFNVKVEKSWLSGCGEPGAKLVADEIRVIGIGTGVDGIVTGVNVAEAGLENTVGLPVLGFVFAISSARFKNFAAFI